MTRLRDSGGRQVSLSRRIAIAPPVNLSPATRLDANDNSPKLPLKVLELAQTADTRESWKKKIFHYPQIALGFTRTGSIV